jgi:hypothetical protein
MFTKIPKVKTYIKSCWCHLLWWMPIENFERKTSKIHMNEGPSWDFKNMFIKQKIFGKKIISKH